MVDNDALWGGWHLRSLRQRTGNRKTGGADTNMSGEGVGEIRAEYYFR